MGWQRGAAAIVLGMVLSVAAAHADDPADDYCKSHSANSVGSYFGGLIHLCGWTVGLSESQPEPAAPAPAAAPPPVVKVLVVFFASGDMDLNTPAKDAVDDAAKIAKDGGFVKIHLIGNTDTAEDDAYVLSLARAQAVRDRMLLDGLNDAAIETEGKAASAPQIPTPPRTQEALNRRVLIQLEK